jgi:hypothetical protein
MISFSFSSFPADFTFTFNPERLLGWSFVDNPLQNRKTENTSISTLSWSPAFQ